jgi:nucleoside-diphosphate-sugar epimerase
MYPLCGFRKSMTHASKALSANSSPLAVGSGVSAYIGEGANQWSAAHIDDTAHLYRLAVERAEPGARYHATAEQGIAFRAIAEAVGAALNLPVVSLNGQEAAEHFGWLTAFVSKDMVGVKHIDTRAARLEFTRTRIAGRSGAIGAMK